MEPGIEDEKLKESERVLALKALYEVVETEFINEQGKIYEKYLVKNTTEEQRKKLIHTRRRRRPHLHCRTELGTCHGGR